MEPGVVARDADQRIRARAGEGFERDVRVDQAVVGELLGDHRDRLRIDTQVVADPFADRRQDRTLLSPREFVRVVDVTGERPHEVPVCVVEHGVIMARRCVR
ncbi:hypothetical protein Q9Q99_16785 [Curtobacterium flaccumfaciens]|nr:hypothetical protein Q9Q99_16785 [Curtobacterium flaccumfaciens]